MFNALAWMWLIPVFVLRDEWVRVLVLIQVPKRVIHLSVLCFICSNVEQQVVHRSMTLWHVPIPDGDIWCLQFLPAGKSSFFNILDGIGVGSNSLFFDIADETVACLGRY